MLPVQENSNSPLYNSSVDWNTLSCALPLEMVMKIFEQISFYDLEISSLVCHEWKEIIIADNYRRMLKNVNKIKPIIAFLNKEHQIHMHLEIVMLVKGRSQDCASLAKEHFCGASQLKMISLEKDAEISPYFLAKFCRVEELMIQNMPSLTKYLMDMASLTHYKPLEAIHTSIKMNQIGTHLQLQGASQGLKKIQKLSHCAYQKELEVIKRKIEGCLAIRDFNSIQELYLDLGAVEYQRFFIEMESIKAHIINTTDKDDKKLAEAIEFCLQERTPIAAQHPMCADAYAEFVVILFRKLYKFNREDAVKKMFALDIYKKLWEACKLIETAKLEGTFNAKQKSATLEKVISLLPLLCVKPLPNTYTPPNYQSIVAFYLIQQLLRT